MLTRVAVVALETQVVGVAEVAELLLARVFVPLSAARSSSFNPIKNCVMENLVLMDGSSASRWYICSSNVARYSVTVPVCRS